MCMGGYVLQYRISLKLASGSVSEQQDNMAVTRHVKCSEICLYCTVYKQQACQFVTLKKLTV
jgi:hypothetical protein